MEQIKKLFKNKTAMIIIAIVIIVIIIVVVRARKKKKDDQKAIQTVLPVTQPTPTAQPQVSKCQQDLDAWKEHSSRAAMVGCTESNKQLVCDSDASVKIDAVNSCKEDFFVKRGWKAVALV